MSDCGGQELIASLCVRLDRLERRVWSDALCWAVALAAVAWFARRALNKAIVAQEMAEGAQFDVIHLEDEMKMGGKVLRSEREPDQDHDDQPAA